MAQRNPFPCCARRGREWKDVIIQKHRILPSRLRGGGKKTCHSERQLLQAQLGVPWYGCNLCFIPMSIPPHPPPFASLGQWQIPCNKCRKQGEGCQGNHITWKYGKSDNLGSFSARSILKGPGGKWSTWVGRQTNRWESLFWWEAERELRVSGWLGRMNRHPQCSPPPTWKPNEGSAGGRWLAWMG